MEAPATPTNKDSRIYLKLREIKAIPERHGKSFILDEGSFEIMLYSRRRLFVFLKFYVGI